MTELRTTDYHTGGDPITGSASTSGRVSGSGSSISY